jgi:hypothetical protein
LAADENAAKFTDLSGWHVVEIAGFLEDRTPPVTGIWKSVEGTTLWIRPLEE